MTLLLDLERFDRDGLKRRFQKNFNSTIFPLYGGYVTDPVRRRVVSQEGLNITSILELPNNLSTLIKNISNNQVDCGFTCGYFFLKNIMGVQNYAQNNGVFYDIHFLTDSIAS